MKRRYDVVVIGAGLGGLSAATFLSLNGYKVLLLERRNIPGGYASSFVRGRFEFEAALHELSGVGLPGNRGDLYEYLESLGLTDRLEFVTPPDVYRSVFPGLDLSLPVGAEPFIETLVETFPRERDGITRFFGRLADLVREVKLYKASTGRPDPRKLTTLLRFMPATFSQVLNRDVSDPMARAVIGQIWGYFGLGPSESSFLYFAVGLWNYVCHGPAYIAGRSQQLTEAFVSRLLETGGEVCFSTGVRRVTTSSGAVTGVITEHDEHIEARAVVSNAHPITLINDLLGRDVVPKRYLNSLRFRRPSPSSFNVYLGLAAPVEELGLTDYEVFINEDPDLDRQAARMSTLDPPLTTTLTTYNAVLPDISPPGTTMTVLTSLMYGKPWFKVPPEDYVATKTRIAEELLQMIEARLCPNLRSRAEVVSVSTPLTNMRYANTMEGALYGASPYPNNATVFRVPYRGPLERLYLVGAWTPPGGGFTPTILGARDAARCILDDIPRRGAGEGRAHV